jgi:hypothetical protein
MTDYLALAEVLAIHDDQIERYGGPPASATAACWKASRKTIPSSTATSGRASPPPTPLSPSTARASQPMPKRRMFSSPGFTRPTISPLKNSQPGYAIMSSPPPHNPLLNMQLGVGNREYKRS